MRVHRAWTTQPWCDSVAAPAWPFAYQKTRSQTLEVAGRVNANAQDLRHACATFGVQSKCHLCENDRMQLQGVEYAALPANIPTVSDVPWAVGGRHRYDYGGASRICVLLSGDSCLSPFGTDYANCSTRCWGVGPVTRQRDWDNVSELWDYGTSASAQGRVFSLAGAGTSGFQDGPAATAQFAYPRGLAVDAAQNVYVADTNNHRIRKIAAGTHVVSTVAGAGTEGFADGPALSATFSFPSSVALWETAHSTLLYVADTGNHRIRVLNLATNMVSCVAGRCLGGTETATLAVAAAPPQPGLSDGSPGNASFNTPTGVAVSPSGVVFVADTGNHIVREISLDGTTTTLAGHVEAQTSPTLGCPPPCVRGVAGFRDGNATYAQFNHPTSIAMGPVNTVLIADDHRVRRVAYGLSAVSGVTADKRVVTVAGAGPFAYSETDGEGTEASFHVSGVAMSPVDQRVFAVSAISNHVRMLSHAASVARSVDCSTRARDVLSPSGCASYDTEASFHVSGVAMSPLDERVFAVSAISNHVRMLSHAASVARSVDCSTRARDVLSPSGCASYEPPTDALHYKVSPAMNNIFYNAVNRSVFSVKAGVHILGRRVQACVGSPPMDALTTGDLCTRLYDANGAPITAIRQDVDVGSTIQVTCPTNCNSPTTPVYGSQRYADASSICYAAIHAGIITGATGGLVTLTLQPNTLFSNAVYRTGSSANGVTSLSIERSQLGARFFSVAATPVTQVSVQTVAGHPKALLESAAGFRDGQPPLAAYFNGPSGVAVVAPPSATSYLYIADTLNHRIRAISAMCSKVCENGGVCSAIDVCTCAAGWTGDDCTTAVCATCGPRELCVGPNQCACVPGYTGAPACTTPQCVQTCANGGRCSAPDTCACANGWFDANCTTPVCSQTCGNGGRCTAPSTCTCLAPWQGADCRTPVCAQSCLNGGTCVAPNTCLCPVGWSGHDCGLPVCDQGSFVPHPSAFLNGLFRPFNWTMYVPCSFDAWCRATNGFDCAKRPTSIVANCSLLELRANALSPFTYLREHGESTLYHRYSPRTPYGQDTLNLSYPGAPVLSPGLLTTPPYTASVDRQLAQVELRVVVQGVYVCANNGNCSAPGICVCAPGWAGFDCRVPVCSQGYYTPTQMTLVAADPIASAAAGHPSSNGNPTYAQTTEVLSWDQYTATTAMVGGAGFLTAGGRQGGYACSIRSLTQFEKPATLTSPANYWDFPNYYSLYMDMSMYWPPLYEKTAPVWDNTQMGYTRNGIWRYMAPTQWQKGTCLVHFQRTCGGTSSNLSVDPDASYRPQLQYTAVKASGVITSYANDCVDRVLRGCYNNGTCIAPDTCVCAAGWTGHDCSVPICAPACIHGTCTNPNRCVCDVGWTGAICNVAICAQDCRNGGHCVAPDTCECVTWPSGWRDGRSNGGLPIFALPSGSPQRTGWTGYDCNTPICTQAEAFVLNVARSDAKFIALRGSLGKVNCTHVRCPQYDIEVTSNDGTSFQSGCPGIPYANPVFGGDNELRQRNWDAYNDVLNDGRQSATSLCRVMAWRQGEFSNRQVRINHETSGEGEGVYKCFHHGSCIAPDTCSCGDGYSGFDCQTPLCRFLTPSGTVTSCQHSGVCIEKDMCRCVQSPSILHQKYPAAPRGMTGWTGSSCSMGTFLQPQLLR
ncbi:hypothetical protein SPRG_07359 [Saprolegnia parasitica CBS 223.65]|uniref:EGF-like domain-containing protein n=1 Tax=Saprolegnia parasitica (strain CBS 223.65) TaxID=695850 RepID=A0A067CML0_SAPPC|nr:hypothetical protein SPRG_07359 [Saprolegnia parasitica CBS 223.65]KDO27761.1 hypothetical protein SPRG_07359 [Saprolegnia parasitica CBS 223.65]|eukprot:XP_012201536.1 hypothetical protein SPRG_07359 [Saprolegnia parasitica CBS 223.65]